MDKLINSIKSIKNRCELIELAYATPGKLHLITTVLEDLYDVIHILIDDYCIERDSEISLTEYDNTPPKEQDDD